MRPWLAMFSSVLCLAQQQPELPTGLLRSYKAPVVPAVQLHNGNRLQKLMRAGKLYLTVQDAIALALENNLDLEVARYGPIAADWQLLRAQAGGPLRGVQAGNSAVNQAASGQGVAGSQSSAGLGGGGGNGSGGGGGNAVVSQIGPVTANLDPVLQNTTGFSHTTTPQATTVQSQTSALVDTRGISNTFVQQGLLSGGYVQLTVNDSYLKENSPTNILNPSVAAVAQIYVRHNFLSAFGSKVNSRFIRVAEKGRKVADETFRSQVMDTVSNVLGLYWNLVSAVDDIKARESTLALTTKFNQDTADEIRLGAVARVEMFSVEGEMKTRQRELQLAQATRRQQENLLKNAISRDGLADPLIEDVEIVPMDSITVPDADDLPPLRDLVARAMAKRPDVAIGKMNDEMQAISALGTANGLLPQLQGIGAVSASGLAGTSQPQGGIGADGYYVGGTATAFGEIVRNNFKNRRGALVFQGTIHNRVAQADYGIDQLQLQQGELVTRRALNQLVVDVSNQMTALRQARARYSVAVDSRKLLQDLLDKQRQKFGLGDSKFNEVIAAQRSLASAQSAEVSARATYQRARLGLDQVLGETMERSNVSMEFALNPALTR